MIQRVSILAALAALGAAAYAGPLSHWKFDESGGGSAADSAGSVTGTLAGSATFVGGGISGNAVAVTGGYVTMGNVYAMIGMSFSIQAWVKTTNGTSSSTIIAGKHNTGSFNGYMVRSNQDTANYGAPNKASFYQSNSPGNTVVGTSDITDDAWHQIVGVYDLGSGQTKLYVDGQLEGSLGNTGIGNNAAPFMVGGVLHQGNLVNVFDGWIDDVQVYDGALNDGQVQYLYDNPGSVVPEPASMLALTLGAAGFLIRRNRK